MKSKFQKQSRNEGPLMTDYRAVLKQVGLAWVAFGLADIGFMIYCISQGQSYSSSFNIFAVVIGFFLMRGSLGATTLVTWFSSFFLAGFIGILVVFLFLQPIDLFMVQARTSPASAAISWLMSIVVLVLLGWSYIKLRSATVLEARKASGRSTAPPKIAFGFGIALAAIMGVLLNMMLNGATGTKAVDLARKQLGQDFKYSTQSFSAGGGHTSAIVAAYNDHEVKYVHVEWNE